MTIRCTFIVGSAAVVVGIVVVDVVFDAVVEIGNGIDFMVGLKCDANGLLAARHLKS